RTILDVLAVKVLHRVIEHPAVEQKRARQIFGWKLDDRNERQGQPRISRIAQRNRFAQFPSVLTHQLVANERVAPVAAELPRFFRRYLVVAAAGDRRDVRIHAEGDYRILRIAINRSPRDLRRAAEHVRQLLDWVAIARRQAVAVALGDYQAEAFRCVVGDTVHRPRHRDQHRVNEYRDREAQRRQDRAPELAAHVAQRDREQLTRHRHASLSELMIPIRDARRAGISPPTTPIIAAAAIPATTAPTLGRYEKNIAPTLIERLVNPVAHATAVASTTPVTPPAIPRIALSITKLLRMSTREKPSTRSTPISRPRRVTAVYIVFIPPKVAPIPSANATMKPRAPSCPATLVCAA